MAAAAGAVVPPSRTAMPEGSAPVDAPAATTDNGAAADDVESARGYSWAPSLDDTDPDCCRVLNELGVWTLSSARAGSGVKQLLGSDDRQYWQSDGTAPHAISVQFYERQSISEVAMLVRHIDDESYTPQVITVRAGSLRADLDDVRHVVLTEDKPVGWLRIHLGDPTATGVARFVRAQYLRIVISQMYQNGRDVHVRCIRVRGPGVRAVGRAVAAASEAMQPAAAGAAARGAEAVCAQNAVAALDDAAFVDSWDTPDMLQWASIR